MRTDISGTTHTIWILLRALTRRREKLSSIRSRILSLPCGNFSAMRRGGCGTPPRRIIRWDTFILLGKTQRPNPRESKQATFYVWGRNFATTLGPCVTPLRAYIEPGHLSAANPA